jgi:hypothetical protein
MFPIEIGPHRPARAALLTAGLLSLAAALPAQPARPASRAWIEASAEAERRFSAGDAAGALAVLEPAMAGPEAPSTRASEPAWELLSRLRLAVGRRDGAIPPLRRCMAILDAESPGEISRRATRLGRLVGLLEDAGRHEEAEAARRAYPDLWKLLAPPPPSTPVPYRPMVDPDPAPEIVERVYAIQRSRATITDHRLFADRAETKLHRRQLDVAGRREMAAEARARHEKLTPLARILEELPDLFPEEERATYAWWLSRKRSFEEIARDLTETRRRLAELGKTR